MKVVSITEAKNRLSALIDEVRAGQTIVIADRGTPVARLDSVSALEESDPSGRLARLARAGILRPATRKASLNLTTRRLPRTKKSASPVQTLIEERRASR